MTSIVQIKTTPVAGRRPQGLKRGELYFNFADRTIGCTNEGGTPIDIAAAIPVSALPPENAVPGMLWYRTNIPAGLYIWFVDADSAQWVQVAGGGSGGGGGGSGGGGAIVGPNPPENPEQGQLWLDTDAGAGALFIWSQDAEAWLPATDLGDLPPATHVGDTPPANPEQGQFWFKTADPVGLFIWYVDADSSQWVSVGGGGGGSGVPVGSISYFAASTPPDGWLLCDGAAVDTLYPDLRAYLLAAGSPFGSSGGNPRVPDLRGEFIRGWDGGRGVDPGRVFGSSQADAFKSHEHSIQGQVIDGAVPGGTTNPSVVPGNRLRITKAEATGGTETRPRNVALLPCIKAFGAVNIEGVAEVLALVATPAEARAGTRDDRLMTPANVRALSGQIDAPSSAIPLTGYTFAGIPDEATEIDLLFDFIGANVAAAHHVDVTLNNLVADYIVHRVALANAVAVAGGDLVQTAIRCEIFANGLVMAGGVKLTRSLNRWLVDGKWRNFPNHVSIVGATPAVQAVNSIKLTPSIALTVGRASLRWRI